MKKLLVKKAMGGWIWVLIVIGIIVLGVLIYFLTKGNDGGTSSGILSNFGGNSGSNLQPPSLPN